MKRFLAITLSALFMFSACGPTVDTTPVTDLPSTDTTETDAPVTSAPETNAPDTDAPSTDGGFEVPDDPTFDLDEKPEDDRKYIFRATFDNISQIDEELKEQGFSYDTNSWQLSQGENGFIYNTNNDGLFRIKDDNLLLVKNSFVFEAKMKFNSLPVRSETAGSSYPLSVLTWIRTDMAGNDSYDWAFKLDDQGVIYISNTTSPTTTKLEAGKEYLISAFYDHKNAQVQIMIDGSIVGVKSLPGKELKKSSLRLCDTGRASYSAEVSEVCAYYADPTDLLKDAERSIFDVVAEKPDATLCFAGYTDKDALSYAVGEEMTFEIYLMANGEVVSAPYFYYSVEGEDGQQKTEGYADGSKGHFTVKAKMSKPGALRINALVCDANKVKQTKNNSKLFINLETSTPQTANLAFKGGAIAGFEQITAGGKVPSDLKEYWDGVVEDCYDGDIKLLRFDELDPKAYNGTNSHKLYLIELECEGGFATGYLTVPQNKDKLKLRVSFVSYGNKKKPSPSFLTESAHFTLCAHSYHLDDPNAAAPDRYGFDATENQNRDTVYFKNMFIRNITATRFLKAFIGDGSYGRILFNGQTIAPLNKWSVGDEYFVNGGSQASFQSVAMAAMDSDVTTASFGVPWFCDIGGDLVGRFNGWNPDYTDALMYYDCCSLATLIEDDVTVTITAGLGDTTSEPSGVVALYNALDCKTTLSMYQNREHTYNPPVSKVYKISK